MVKVELDDLLEITNQPKTFPIEKATCILQKNMYVQVRRSKNGWLDFVWRINPNGQLVDYAENYQWYRMIRTTWAGGPFGNALWSWEMGTHILNMDSDPVDFSEVDWDEAVLNDLLHEVLNSWLIATLNAVQPISLRGMIYTFNRLLSCF